MLDTIRQDLERSGYALLTDALDAPSMATLGRVADQLAAGDGPEVVRTPAGETQSVYGVHGLAPEVIALLRTLDLHKFVAELLGEPCYVLQSQLHLKPLSSPVLPWHQDYNAFQRRDGLPAGRGYSMIMFGDAVEAHSAPMFVIPGSHRKGVIPSRPDRVVPDQAAGPTPKAPQYIATAGAAERLAIEYGVAALTGPAGTIGLMDLHLLHASGVSVLDQRRALFHFTLVGTSNRTTNGSRPAWVVDPQGPVID